MEFVKSVRKLKPNEFVKCRVSRDGRIHDFEFEVYPSLNFSASSNTNSTKEETFKINFAITGNSNSAQFTILVNGATRSTFGTFTGSALHELEFNEGVYDLRVEMSLFGEKQESILHIPKYRANEDKTLYISY